MTTAAGSSAEIVAYLAAVRAALSDLPEDERADLLAEVEASLVEAVGEGERTIASLGPPQTFAAELRASAGLGEQAAPAVSRSAVDALRAAVAELGRHPAIQRATQLARELAPAWWLVRGGLLIAAAASATGASWSIAHPWLPHLPSAPRHGVLARRRRRCVVRSRIAHARPRLGRHRDRRARDRRGRAARDRSRRAPRARFAARHSRSGRRRSST